jgi:hypothetical protein
MNRFVILACSAAIGLPAACSSVSASDQQNRGSGWPTLEGAWQVETTVRLHAENCATAALAPPGYPNPFPAFNMFHSDGTMSEHGSRSSPSHRSPGFGVWERTGKRQYEYRVKFHTFNDEGVLNATMDMKTELTLAKDGKRFEGVSRPASSRVDGTVQNFCATMTGERITIKD